MWLFQRLVNVSWDHSFKMVLLTRLHDVSEGYSTRFWDILRKRLSTGGFTYSPGRGVVGAGSGGRCGWAGQGGFDIYFCVFWLLLPGFDFGGGDWALGYVCAQIWDFPNISLFPRILSLKLFGNSYTKFALVDITFRFTCGSSGLY